MITIPIAQISSEYVPAPKTCAKLVTLTTDVPGVVISSRVGDDQRQPVEEEQHRQRRDERRDPDVGDEEAVDRAQQHRGDQRHDHGRDERQARLGQLPVHERREQVQRPDRQIDLAERHHEHLPRRHDREDR